MLAVINAGDTAFLLISAALVFIMTPGLALFYTGLVVKRRNALDIIMQVMISVAIVAVIWVLFGFSLVFGEDVVGVIGDLTYAGLTGVGELASSIRAPNIPFLAYFSYEVMFAIITPALITGAFADRLNLGRYLLLLTGFSIFIYLPVAHWVWGGGFLERLGVIDWAGGIVVHTTAGTTALAGAILAGRRQARGTSEQYLHRRTESAVSVALGTGLLWFGWFGFNAGSAFAANGVAAVAFVNTLIAPSVATLIWAAINWVTQREADLAQTLTGTVAGLASITPAAGYVQPWGAAAIGFAGGTLTYLAVQFRKRMGWDDAVDVWGIHGVAGPVGTILVGVLAVAAVNGVSGLVEGSGRQFVVQLAGVATALAYTFFVAWIILTLIERGYPTRQS